MHFDFYNTVALAVFAAPAFYVKAKTASFVAANIGFGGAGKKFAHRGKNTGISGGVRPWRTANRRLIDHNNFVECLYTFDCFVPPGNQTGTVQLMRQLFSQNVVYQ